MKSTEIFKKNPKKIIKENDNLNDFSEFLIKNEKYLNKPLLEYMFNENIFLYRGTYTSGDRDFFIVKPKTDRQPRDTPNFLHNFINSILEDAGANANRSNSFFTTTKKNIARRYGNVYYVFPLKNFSFSYIENIEDFYFELIDTIRNDIKDFFEKNGYYPSFIKGILRKKIFSYISDSNISHFKHKFENNPEYDIFPENYDIYKFIEDSFSIDESYKKQYRNESEYKNYLIKKILTNLMDIIVDPDYYVNNMINRVYRNSGMKINEKNIKKLLTTISNEIIKENLVILPRDLINDIKQTQAIEFKNKKFVVKNEYAHDEIYTDFVEYLNVELMKKIKTKIKENIVFENNVIDISEKLIDFFEKERKEDSNPEILINGYCLLLDTNKPFHLRKLKNFIYKSK